MLSDDRSKSDRDLNLVTVCRSFPVTPRLDFDGKGILGDSLVLGSIDNNSSSFDFRRTCIWFEFLG